MTTFFGIFFIIFIQNVISLGRIGMNVGAGNYYSKGQPFLNRLYTAQPFIKENTTIKFDANGYPTKLLSNETVGALFMSLGFDDYGIWPIPKSMQGLHVFNYHGNCTDRCSFRWNAVIVNQSESGRWILNVSQPMNDPHANKCGIYIKGPFNESDYPHNFSLVPIQYENNWQEIVYEPTWIQPLLNPANENSENVSISFDSIRFMVFLDTVSTQVSSWQQRTLPSNFTQANGQGASWEFVITLMNTLGNQTSPWINIPPLADDDYIKNLALLWKNSYKYWGVTPIYIEYGNECWAGGSICYSYCEEMGNKTNQNAHQYYAMRLCEIREIFESVIGSKDNDDDYIYIVAGAQTKNYWVIIEEFQFNNYSLCMDGMAIAPYYCTFNLTGDQIVNMSYDQLFDNIESYDNQESDYNLYKDNLIAANSNIGHNGKALGIITYEGSWGCTPQYGPYHGQLTEVYNNMTLLPRVGDTVYDNIITYFKAAGQGSLFNIFSYIGWAGQYGNWGHLQYQTDFYNKSSPGRYKWDGMIKYMQGQ